MDMRHNLQSMSARIRKHTIGIRPPKATVWRMHTAETKPMNRCLDGSRNATRVVLGRLSCVSHMLHKLYHQRLTLHQRLPSTLDPAHLTRDYAVPKLYSWRGVGMQCLGRNPLRKLAGHQLGIDSQSARGLDVNNLTCTEQALTCQRQAHEMRVHLPQRGIDSSKHVASRISLLLAF